MPRDRRHAIILPLVALIPVLPLILRGCSCGHDFDFHIVSWFEAAKQFSHGMLHPHWAYTPAWYAGEPRFVFYPPLSWIIGALLGLLLPWTWTPIVYTWIALTAAGFALHSLARSFVPRNAALVAAAVYIANPYMLYTAYERTAYAELLAAAWLPLLLGGILRRRVSLPRIAIPVALLWLTNAPAAVMGCYALALLTLLRIVMTVRAPHAPEAHDTEIGSIPLASITIAGTLLGLGLASFYIIPAAYERRFVQIAFAILPGLSPQDNFLFHHTKDIDHDMVLRTASVVAVLLIGLTALTLLVAWTKSRTQPASQPGTDPARSSTLPQYLLPALAALALAIVFMLTPLSAPLWRQLPQLRFLQFPWRLIAILSAVFALSLAIALSRIAIRSAYAIAASLAAAAAFTISAYAVFHQRCYPEDTLPQRLAVFNSANPGTDPTDEYTPTTADNNALAQTHPAYWIAQEPSAVAPEDAQPGPAPGHLTLSLKVPSILILNLRDYPAWRITRNGSPLANRLHRDDGLIAVPLSAGPSFVEIAYVPLADQRIGYLISVLSLLSLAPVSLSRSGSRADMLPPG